MRFFTINKFRLVCSKRAVKEHWGRGSLVIQFFTVLGIHEKNQVIMGKPTPTLYPLPPTPYPLRETHTPPKFALIFLQAIYLLKSFKELQLVLRHDKVLQFEIQILIRTLSFASGVLVIHCLFIR